jgi:hypothetical protein
MNDTAPEIAEKVGARLMALAGATQLAMGVEMFEGARRVIIASIAWDRRSGVSQQILRNLFLVPAPLDGYPPVHREKANSYQSKL